MVYPSMMLIKHDNLIKHCCKKSKRWLIVLECPKLPVPLNGYKKGNMNNVGSKVILGCEDGFYDPNFRDNITYPVISQCTANETNAFWSVQPFNCSGN